MTGYKVNVSCYSVYRRVVTTADAIFNWVLFHTWVPRASQYLWGFPARGFRGSQGHLHSHHPRTTLDAPTSTSGRFLQSKNLQRRVVWLLYSQTGACSLVEQFWISHTQVKQSRRRAGHTLQTPPSPSSHSEELRHTWVPASPCEYTHTVQRRCSLANTAAVWPWVNHWTSLGLSLPLIKC